MTLMQALTLQHYRDALGDLCLGTEGDLSTPVQGATGDSRQVRPGWLFCAIPGSHVDGACYIPAALAAGASALVVAAAAPVPDKTPTLRVSDCYAAAGRLAECLFGYPARDLDLYGITGTNGKTTTAFLLQEILRHAGRRTGMVGTVRYDLGKNESIPAQRTTPTPFELQGLLATMRHNNLDAAVLEVSSHALHQRRLGTSRLQGAIFTNLTQDHLDYHHSFEEYFTAKKRLFNEYLGDKAPALINLDTPYGKRLYKELAAEGIPHCLGFGTCPEAEVRLDDRRLGATQSSLTLCTREHRLPLTSPLIGEFNLYNVAAAAALALALKLPPERISEAIRVSRGAPGRLQALHTSRGVSIYIDYAHTDDALRNVLSALRGLSPRRLLLVFGCGGDRDPGKRPLMGRAAAELADLLFVTSDNPRSENPEAIIEQILSGVSPGCQAQAISDRREAIQAAVAAAAAGDILLIAGKGHETYQEIRATQIPFDDVHEACRAVAQQGGHILP